MGILSLYTKTLQGIDRALERSAPKTASPLLVSRRNGMGYGRARHAFMPAVRVF